MLIANGRNGQLSFDGEWLTFVGTDAVRLHVSRVSGVQLKRPSLTAGLLRFTAGAGEAVTLTFTTAQTAPVLALRDAVQRVRTAQPPPPPPDLAAVWESASPPTEQLGLADQLALVAKLWDEGALTGEEFAEAKRRLLEGCTCGSRPPVRAEVVQGRPLRLTASGVEAVPVWPPGDG